MLLKPSQSRSVAGGCSSWAWDGHWDAVQGWARGRDAGMSSGMDIGIREGRDLENHLLPTPF